MEFKELLKEAQKCLENTKIDVAVFRMLLESPNPTDTDPDFDRELYQQTLNRLENEQQRLEALLSEQWPIVDTSMRTREEVLQRIEHEEHLDHPFQSWDSQNGTSQLIRALKWVVKIDD